MSREIRPPSLGRRMLERMLFAEPAILTTIAVAVMLSAFVVAAGPRLAERVAAEDLRHTLTMTEPESRSIRLERITRIGAGAIDTPYSRIEEAGERFFEQGPAPVVNAISSQRWVMDSAEMIVDPMPGDPPLTDDSTVKFRAQKELEDHLEVVRGVMPSPQEPIEMLLGTECPTDPEERDSYTPVADVDCYFDDVPVYQAAMTEETATDLHMDVGDRVLLRPDVTDGLYGFLSPEQLAKRIVLELSAVVSLDPIEDPFWFGDNSLHRPRTLENADFRFVFASVILSPQVYPSLFPDMGLPQMRYTWRYTVDPDALTPASAALFASSLSEYDSNLPSAASAPDHLDLLTGLPALIDEFFAQQAEVLALMSTSIAGVIAMAAGVVLVLSALVAERERRSLVLARSRGASPGQVTVTKFYQALILSIPAALVGYLIAALVLADTAGLGSQRATLSLVAIALLAVVFAVLPIARGSLSALLSERERERSGWGRRAVVEILIVVLAAGAVISLRRRSQAEVPDPDRVPVDLLFALTPALVALAVGVIALRLFDPVMSAAAWLASKRRGLVGFFGFRRVTRQRVVERLPMIVIVLSVGMLSYAAIVQATIGSAQREAALEVVGADYRIRPFDPGAAFVGEVDPGVVDGVEAWSIGSYIPDAIIDIGVSNRSSVPVLALDAAAHGDVLTDSDEEFVVSPELTQAPKAEIGTIDDPLPIVVSTVWPGMPPPVGTVGTLFIGTKTINVRVVAEMDGFGGLDSSLPFVLTQLDGLRAANEPTPVRPNRAWVRADEEVFAELAAEIDRQALSVIVDSRYETLSLVADDPFVAWIGRGLTVTSLIALAFAAVAAASSLALATTTRRRDFAYLRTLGLDTSQAASLTILEQLPMTVAAILAGLGAGVGVAIALEPALAVGDFSGGLIPDDLVISWGRVLTFGSLVLIVLTVAVVIFMWTDRRVEIGQVLRVGEDL